MNRPTVPLLCAALSMAATCAWSQEERPAARLIDGTFFPATLDRLESSRVLFRSGDQKRATPLDDLLRWGQPADVRRGAYVLLADGGVVAGEVKAVSADHVVVES